MSKFKEKTQGFIVGLMVGLLVAGGFFILKLDSYFKELNFYKSLVHTFSSETKTADSGQDAKSSSDDKDNKSNTTNHNNNSLSNSDSTKRNIYSVTPHVLDEDTISTASSTDSLNNNSISSDEVVVRKDEMVGAKTLEVINLNPASTRTNAKDSLLQKISGVQEDKNTGKQLFNIEFWQSPLNYKGYKMSKSKIVLFGLASDEGIKVFKTDDAIYLKNMTAVYRLDYASELKPYEKISDESIISKLK